MERAVLAEVNEVVAIFQYFLTVVQNLGNPWVFFPIIVFLTGYFAWKLEFGLARGWKGLDYYLAILALGLCMQSFPLAIAFVFAKLGQMLGLNFDSLFALSLFLFSFYALGYFILAKLETQQRFSETYKRILAWFWRFVAIIIMGAIIVPTVIAFGYPTYLSSIIMPGWSTFLIVVIVFLTPLCAFVILLNRWFILPTRPRSALHPFSRKEVRTSFGERVGRRKRELGGLLLTGFLIFSLVALDSTLPILTPKVVIGPITRDHYSNEFEYSKIDYILLFEPGRDGRLAPHLYTLYNVSVTMIGPTYGLESCVRYSNPVEADYQLYDSYSIFNYGYFSQPPNYLPPQKLITNSTILTSWPNVSSTYEIGQCVPGVTHFYAWREIAIPTSISVSSSCIYHGDDHIRTDTIAITNSGKLPVLLGGIKINYLQRDSPIDVGFIINGRNVTGYSGGVMNYGIVAVPFSPMNDLSTQIAYTVEISYSSYFDNSCQLE
jgi:MFS family permease